MDEEIHNENIGNNVECKEASTSLETKIKSSYANPSDVENKESDFSGN